LAFNEKSGEVCVKTRSPPALLAFVGQVTKHTTVKWLIAGLQFLWLWTKVLGTLNMLFNELYVFYYWSLRKGLHYCSPSPPNTMLKWEEIAGSSFQHRMGGEVRQVKLYLRLACGQSAKSANLSMIVCRAVLLVDCTVMYGPEPWVQAYFFHTWWAGEGFWQGYKL